MIELDTAEFSFAHTAPCCGALIVGGAHGALAAARSLGRRGISVWALYERSSPVKYSRYVRRAFAWPGPHAPESAGFLIDLAPRQKLAGALLIPGGDEEARLIAQNHTALSPVFRLTTPPWRDMRWAYDKRLTYARAESLGLDFPRSYTPQSRAELAGLDIRYPAILKPAVRGRKNAFTMAKAWRAEDASGLLSLYSEAAELVGAGGIVVQELIPGGGEAQFSYAAVWDRGRPVASLVARRLRQYPIDFGYSSTFVKTTEQPEVEEAACRFLSSIGYHGLVEVEFKRDARDGGFKLLDVNARIWTWLALGEAAGVDFPHLLWRVAMGENVPDLKGRPGKSWMHFSRDLIALLQLRLHGQRIPPDYLPALLGSRFAAFAMDDPLPSLADVVALPLRLATGRLPASIGRVVTRLRARTAYPQS